MIVHHYSLIHVRGRKRAALLEFWHQLAKMATA
jgi:hypothetical protein